jgi:hypothetical protein
MKKTLPEILRDAMLLLDDGREDIVIARGQQLEALDGQALRLLRSKAFQIRLWHDTRDDPSQSQYRCEARTWLGAQWSSWSAQCGWLGGAGFDIHDVLATDWRIAS